MNRVLVLTAALAVTLLTAACNTIEGAGEDIQSGGRTVERAANDSK